LSRKILRETESLCPECLDRIPAWIVARDGMVYLDKECPEHGVFSVIVWRGDVESYLSWEMYAAERETGGRWKTLTESKLGCPYDCGICPQHEQGAVSVAIMSTNRCNLSCPICFTDDGDAPIYEPDYTDIEEMLRMVYQVYGNIPVEFCGGEPTIRDDLPELVSMAASMGFDHVQINTNGVRISEEWSFLEKLKTGGATTIYLQFDGVDDGVYRKTRGVDLYGRKLEAVQNCAEVKIGVVLVPTVVKGVNFHQLGDIIRFAKAWIPTVRGVYFQPISYFGKYPVQPRNEDRLTIPDILNAIEEQTRAELKRTNFLPPACEHAFCSFSGFAILREDGSLFPTTHLGPRRIGETGLDHAREFTKKYWRYYEESPVSEYASKSQRGSVYQDFVQRLNRRSLFISGMLFQDVWNLDLDRLRRCCIHIATQDQRMIPLCAKYLTSANGRRLYPGMA
jgi:uncharacterized radical SAM superfamily Fe-S cluster-containing enzyme